MRWRASVFKHHLSSQEKFNCRQIIVVMRIITVDGIAVNLPLSTVKLLMRFNSFELSGAFHTAAGQESEQSMIFHSFQFQKSNRTQLFFHNFTLA